MMKKKTVIVIFIVIMISLVLRFIKYIEIKLANDNYYEEYVFDYNNGSFFIISFDNNGSNKGKTVRKNDIPTFGEKIYIKEESGNEVKFAFDSADFKMSFLNEENIEIKIDFNDSLQNKIYISYPTVMNIENKVGTFLLSTNVNYKKIEEGSIVKELHQPFIIQKIKNKVEIIYRHDPQTIMDIWGSYSKEKLLGNKTLEEFLRNQKIGNGREILIDGYYFETPTSYEPYFENSLWRIPSQYIIDKFIKQGTTIGEEIVGRSMLTLSIKNINKEGYIPTLPKSLWLNENYSYGKYFFDTRFNSNTIETFLVGYQKYKDKDYREAYLKMAQYYYDHIVNNNFKNKGSENIEGWLMEDYAQEGSIVKTHSSLNHQLHAMTVFYKLYLEEKDERYLHIGNKMLQGIKNIKEKYIIDNGGLEYAYLPNGEMGFVDYPFLTYNDLFLAQKVLKEVRGYTDKDLEYLMIHKKKQMDLLGIKGYLE